MIKTVFRYCVIFSLYVLHGFTFAQNTPVFFIRPWNDTFTLKTTENGEFLTVTAMASMGSYLYLYDLSDRSLVTIDSTAQIISKVILESIGRSTYTGDDFVVRDNQAIFLNAVDYHLEYFQLETGKHLKSISFSRDLLNEEKRSRKIINRIFLDNNSILLGNSHTLVVFSESALSKQMQSLKVLHFPENKRILFYNRNKSIELSSGVAHYSGRTLPVRKSVVSFSGKSMVLLNGTPVQCITTQNGIEIYRE
ncbi:MAG: hypothetical protein GX640_07660 [Fibrobacter sp.]|nr:hypothetical protein [Fibrobacter sp.]